MNILQINGSARSSSSYSTRVANQISERLLEIYSSALLRVRDLAAHPLPPLDERFLQARETPHAERTNSQRLLVAQHAVAIGDLQECDILVLGVPMYNFGVSVQLKAWMDAVALAGTTFRYTSKGAEGLLTGKKVYLALARGGRYLGTETDHQSPHLLQFLNFLGIKDITLIPAEGLALGADSVKLALESAKKLIDEKVIV
jgi:FMN-dependent NADH-azoreductase